MWSDCIKWWGLVDRNGYGKGYFGKRVEWAHRAIYETCFGFIPDGMQIDHLCKNKLCVNPSHLEVVTPRENTRRHFRGKTHCVHGHSYKAYPPIKKPNGTICCSECKKIRKRKASREKRAEELLRRQKEGWKPKSSGSRYGVEQYITLHNQGLGPTEIARITGATPAAVSSALRARGLRRGGKAIRYELREAEFTAQDLEIQEVVA